MGTAGLDQGGLEEATCDMSPKAAAWESERAIGVDEALWNWPVPGTAGASVPGTEAKSSVHSHAHPFMYFLYIF